MQINESITCLVIMPFDDRYAIIYQDFYHDVCVNRLHIKCCRLDDEKFMKPGHVSDDMLDMIKDADIIIADTSTNNPNVFYELGYAHRDSFHNVVLTREKNDVQLPFDIKDVRTIHYDRADLSQSKQVLHKTILNMLSDKSVPETSVKTFYRKMCVRQYSRSWDYLAPEFKQSRWSNDIVGFIDGYKHTISISHLHISPLSKEHAVSKFHVSFVEEINTLVIDELVNFSRKTFSSIDRLKTDLEALKKLLDDKGFDSSVIDDLTFNQLVSPNRGTIIAWLLEQKSKKDTQQLFKIRNLARQHVCLEVILNKYNDEWLVSKIRPMQFE